jgi:hypothetical protein
MGLGNDDDPADAERREFVKVHVDDGGLRGFGGLDHDGFNLLEIVEQLGIARLEFHQEMRP